MVRFRAPAISRRLSERNGRTPHCRPAGFVIFLNPFAHVLPLGPTHETFNRWLAGVVRHRLLDVPQPVRLFQPDPGTEWPARRRIHVSGRFDRGRQRSRIRRSAIAHARRSAAADAAEFHGALVRATGSAVYDEFRGKRRADFGLVRGHGPVVGTDGAGGASSGKKSAKQSQSNSRPRCRNRPPWLRILRDRQPRCRGVVGATNGTIGGAKDFRAALCRMIVIIRFWTLVTSAALK